jgi:hypothetical protein
MRKTIAAFFAILLCVPLVFAGDPWKDKSYTEWTMEDVQKILGDSPWVKEIPVDAPWIKGQPQLLRVMQAGCGGRPDLSKPMRTPPHWSMGIRSQSVVSFQVTWESAKTVRAAKLRRAVLCGRTDNDRIEHLAEQEQENFLVTVFSPDMSPFDGMSKEQLIANTYLMPKKNKQQLAPTNVTISQGFDRKTVHRLTFQFPKKTDSGEPTIAPDEKEIELICSAGKIVLKARFQPPKMTTKNGIDF